MDVTMEDKKTFDPVEHVRYFPQKKTWQGSYYESGKRKFVYYADRTESPEGKMACIAKLLKAMNASRGNVVVLTRHLLSVELDKWVESYERIGTRKRYAGLVAKYLKSLGRKFVEEITVEDIKATLLKVRKLGGDYQRNAVLAILRQTFDSFGRKGWTQIDLKARDCEIKEVPWQTKRHREIREDEEEALLEAARSDPLWYTMLRFLFSFSPRRNELLGLTWGDVAIRTGKVFIGGSLVWERGVREKGLPKSAESERVLPIVNEDIVEVIKAHRAWCEAEGHSTEPDAPMFPNSVGRYMTPVKFNEGFRKIREAAGLPYDVVPHGARGALASRAHRAGVELNTIRVFLGHADISTTQEYLSVHEDDLARMAGKIQKKRGPS